MCVCVVDTHIALHTLHAGGDGEAHTHTHTYTPSVPKLWRDGAVTGAKGTVTGATNSAASCSVLVCACMCMYVHVCACVC